MLNDLMDWAHYGLGMLVGGCLMWARYEERVGKLTRAIQALEEFIDTNAPKWGVDR